MTAADHNAARAPRRRPVRTCIGCRERADDQVLLRVVAIDTTGSQAHPGEPGDVPVMVVVDPRRRLPGRGAWLHPTPACVDLAVRRRAFGRALRVPGRIDPAPVGEYVARMGRDGPAAPAAPAVRPGTAHDPVPTGTPVSRPQETTSNERSMKRQR
ncbi:YlxR family protein [Jatrophihabitans fulvus]